MEEVERWFKKAKRDLKQAKDNFKIKNYDLSAFLCQQAIEKGLKSILLKKENKIKKIHDLIELGKSANLPNNFLEYCKEITHAYIYSRYPDIEEPKDIKEISSNFIKHTQEILKWINSQV